MQEGPTHNLMRDEFQKKVDRMKAADNSKPGPDCPAEGKWLEMAADLLPEAEAGELLEHSTGCDACGVLLRQATEDLAPEAQENGEISALASAQKDWQRALAQEIGAQSKKQTKPAEDRWAARVWRPRPAFQFAWAYATAAVVLIAAGIWLVPKLREPSLNQLIASSYTAQRPFEMRLAGAAHGHLRQLRSGERSSLSQPAALSRAAYMIKEKLASRPDDAEVLAVSGRVQLLEGNYETAVKTFGRLVDAHPDSPTLLTDLATAYFQRAESADRATDYAQAVELLSRALAKSPDDPVALFNRAIALEKMFAFGAAIKDWEHFLRVEPSNEWKAEAEGRLNELREKMKTREKPAALLKKDPAEALPLLRARAAGRMDLPAPWAPALDEEYMGLAVREWLPALFVPVNASGGQRWRREPAVWDALNATAEVLVTHHQDRWLADLLRELPGESAPPDAVGQFVSALDSLAQAARANEAGDPDAARPPAETAAQAFRAIRSTAGLLRAREEVIYSHLRAVRATECNQAAGQQLGEARLDSYPWLKVQAMLWHATCESVAGNLDLAQRLSEGALQLTRGSGYAGQHLRSVFFAAGIIRSAEGNWQNTWAGLKKFWAEWHNPFHAYESYTELAFQAAIARRLQLYRVLYREAVDMIERTPDRSFGATAHYGLAVAALRVRDAREAEAEFRIASQKFATLPLSPANKFYRLETQIQLAGVEVEQGAVSAAMSRLADIREYLKEVSEDWTAFRYFQTLGQLHLRQGNRQEAEKNLWRALRVSEGLLVSLGTDADRVAWDGDAGQSYRTLVDLYAQKPEESARALEVWEWYRAAALRGSPSSSAAKPLRFGSSNPGPGPPVLSQAGDTLPALKHETVISHAILPSGVAAWAFDNRGVKFARISASEEDLAARVKYFAFLCADPSSDITKLRQEGRSLYDLLLAAFESHLDTSRRLVIEPDGFLSEVPWPALVDSRGEYLGSKFSIVVSPGLGYWLKLRLPAAISSRQPALVVGMPALAPGVAARFAPLPDADREAREIAERFRQARILSGTEVTAAGIRRELPRSAVFHFAGHAVSGATESGLVLASAADPGGDADEPTLLSGRNLEEALLRRLQLVVLSACATAETEKGFAVPDTLLRRFLRSGVPHVVASRWPVDSRTTEKTMGEFYSRLFNSLPPAEALQQVTKSILLQPATAHPYYWAAFGAYGR